MAQYCKAYTLDHLRQYRNWPTLTGSKSDALPGTTLCYVWNDYRVSRSPVRGKVLLLDTVTAEWQKFCTTILQFSVPEEEETAPVGTTSVPQQSMLAEQGDIVGYVPVNKSQLGVLNLQTSPMKWYVSAKKLEVEVGIDYEILQKALHHLWCHHDSLRSRFFIENGQWRQYIDPPIETQFLEYMDLTHLSEEEQANERQQHMHRVHQSIDYTTGPLMKGIFFPRGPQRNGLLYLAISHFATDMSSMQILMEDFSTAALQLQQGQEVRLPMKTTSVKTWSERMSWYCHTEECRKTWMEPFARSVAAWPEPELKKLPVDFEPGTFTHSTKGDVISVFEPDETRNIRAFCRHTNTAVLDFLLTALTVALSDWTGARSFPATLVVHGRDTIFDDIDLSRTVNSFSLMCIEILSLGTARTPREALEYLKQFRYSVPQPIFARILNLFTYADEHWIDWPPYKSEIHINYGGIMPPVERLPPIRTAREQALQHNYAHEENMISIRGFFQGERLYTALQYNTGYYRRSTIESVSSFLVRAIRSLIAV